MATAQKKPRSNLVLPTTRICHSRVDQLDDLIEWLWHASSEWPSPQPFDLLRVYISLITDSVMPPNVAREVLRYSYNMDLRDLSQIEIPAQRGENDKRTSRLGLGPRSRLAIHCALAVRAASRVRNTRLLTDMSCDADVTTELNRQLTLATESAGRSWTLTLADIAELAPYFCVRKGAEPYHFTLLSARIRPTSQDEDDPYALTGVAEEMMSHLFHGDGGFSANLRSTRADATARLESDLEPPPEWIAESKSILRALCTGLDKQVPKHCNTTHKRQIAREIFANIRERVPDYYPASCVTRLTIDFAEKRFVGDQKVIARTVRDYLSRCIINGLLCFDEAFSLADWDPDDFYDAVEDRINSNRLCNRTKSLVLIAYNQFLRFACPKLGIPTVSLTDLKQQFLGGAGQWRLLSPHVVDRLLRQLAESGHAFNRQIAVTIAFGYYGGLRASEIRRLTLANIVIDHQLGLFELELLRGKTPSARRRVPLHALAGCLVLDLIQEEVEARKGQFSAATQLSKIALLGHPAEKEGYNYQSLALATRAVLRAAFGESANIHLLRHSFCSNLFVRWYSLLYPDLLDNHRDRSHDLYQYELQSRLRAFFQNLPGQEENVRASDLVVIIKVTGHASPLTLFVYYVHSYTLVHQHTVSRISEGYLDDTFSNCELELLIPGMRSSASRAQLADRTIRGLCEHRNIL